MNFASGFKMLAATVVCSIGMTAQAAVVWDEVNNGDLSNDQFSPTTLIVSTGSNTVFGTTGNAGQGIDRDYFKFVVPTGATLTALKILPNTSVSGGASFIAIQSGPQITVSPTGAGVENLLGFTHYSNDLIGTDILPTLIFGLSGGLSSGTYSVWVQETGGPASYGFDFGIAPAPVPLPGAGVFLLSSLFGLAVVRRR